MKKIVFVGIVILSGTIIGATCYALGKKQGLIISGNIIDKVIGSEKWNTLVDNFHDNGGVN